MEITDLRSPASAAFPSAQPLRQEIVFHTPGLKRYKTADYENHCANAFVPISVTGTACALNCDHCGTRLLRSMHDLSRSGRSLYDFCAELKSRGARGVLISGGSDKQGRVPLFAHIPDMARIRRELGLTIRVHPGLPDGETCAALAEVGVDGAMIDVIGHRDTSREVYHLEAGPDDFEQALAGLEQHHVPTIPHIILGLHYGRILGEWTALQMIARHPPQVLVLVILTPLSDTRMVHIAPPPPDEIGEFFVTARHTLGSTPVMLGCARPLGPVKARIDRLAIDAGLDGIAYPAEGTVAYARAQGRVPRFVDACCGINW